jgi:hypothetical protein
VTSFYAFDRGNPEGSQVAKYVVILTFQNEENRLKVRPKHREYLAQLLVEGKLILSGPFADEKGALIMYEADSEDEARALIAADPYYGANAIADLQLREWKQVYPEL